MSGPPDTLGHDKAPQRIAAMFDAIAPRYDLLNHVLSAGLDLRWRAKAVRSLGLTGGEKIVDLCTGTGDLALALARARPRAGRVVGVDFSGGMLRVGRAKACARGLADRIRLVRGDVTRLPLADGSADAATVAFGIRNIQRPAEAFSEVFRVLRSGGRFAMLEFSTPSVPGLRGLYLWYFTRILPWAGALISGHGSAYAYLPASVEAFPDPGRVTSDLAATGFSHIRADPLALGIVYLYSARKPPRS
ncbi:MAG TPA: bifunctional demethylmenaquinone methyltransferase/2-methoxy-6-polyprenyl-1,4-benzoquinol methylase UbiE [Vicinamibacterales bacterium]|nr:bifunctional demethylmenaquinone methyltransferase/2-methoxy-6-polyprenyl-1,4-benzoquinol methylase UbiE [Vicinamibacterales bacterium]